MTRSNIRRDLLRDDGEITGAVRPDQGAGEYGKRTKMWFLWPTQPAYT
jgi:hypothetical protein